MSHADGDLEGVCLAFEDTALEPSPGWTRIDAGVTRVASYMIDRGRQFELDTTDGGRATVAINDVDGTLNPTNSSGPYYGQLEPGMQAGIARRNPVTDTWHTRFRGFVDDFDYVFDPSQRLMQLTLSLVDIYDRFQRVKMQPGKFGVNPALVPIPYIPEGAVGNVWFTVENVDDRIKGIVGDTIGVSLVDDWAVVFTGNVELWTTAYSPGESPLTAIQEAVDAEWPGVSNLYPDRHGRLCFHGRLAKFDPTGTAASTTPDRWDLQQWQAGDGQRILNNPGFESIIAQLREFAANRGTWAIRNSALATYLGIRQVDIPGQLVEDTGSIDARGVCSWSAQNLLTKRGLLDSSTALVETKRFAQYIVDNYSEPRDRVSVLGFGPVRPDDPRAEAIWKVLAQCDIADTLELQLDTTTVGGFPDFGGFVEGVHEEVRGRLYDGVELGDEGYDDVRLRVDISPAGLFASNPFPTS